MALNKSCPACVVCGGVWGMAFGFKDPSLDYPGQSDAESFKYAARVSGGRYGERSYHESRLHASATLLP